MNRRNRTLRTAARADSIESGIAVHDAQVKYVREKSRFMWLIPSMLAALMLSGAMLVYFNSLAIRPSVVYFAIVAGCCCLVSWLCLEQNRAVRRVTGVISISAFILLYIALNSRFFAAETDAIIQSLASLICRVFRIDSPLLARREGLMLCYNSLPIYICMASLILSYTLIYLRNPLYTLAAAAPFSALAYFDGSLSLIGAMLLISSTIAYCVVIITDQHTFDEFASRKAVFFRFMRNKALLSTAAIMLVPIVLLTAISSIFVNPRHYTLDRYVDTARENVVDFFDRISKLKLFSGNGGNLEGFSEGNLRGVGNRVFTYENQLYIETDILGAIYIKSYTGSVYEGNEWNDIPNSYYSELFNTEGFNTSSIITLWRDNHAYLSRLDMMSNHSLSITDIMETKRYGYMPYCIYGAASSTGAGISVLLDRDARASDDGTYSYALYDFEGNYTYGYYEWLLRNYSCAEADIIAIYSDFVRARYTQLPAASQRIADEFGHYSHLGIDEKLTLVREYLYENTTYTLSPGQTPSDRDFATYFLYESRSGYCIHYATAATLILRAMGVPARFAEGYLYYGGGSDAVNGAYLTDADRHAWVEVYYDGLGWLPVEFTKSLESNIGATPRPTATSRPTATPRPTSTPAPTIIPPASAAPSVAVTPSPSATPNPSGGNASPTPDSNASDDSNSHDRDSHRSLYDLIFKYEDGSNASPLLVLLRLSPSILFIIFSIFALRLYIVISRRRKRFSSKYPNAALEMYSYILSLTKRYGLTCDAGATPFELAKLLKDTEFDDFADRLIGISDCIYALRFANIQPDAVQLHQLNSFVRAYENRYYMLQTRFWRIVCILIYGIFPVSDGRKN